MGRTRLPADPGQTGQGGITLIPAVTACNPAPRVRVRPLSAARLNASILYENRPMLRILEKLGFRLIPSSDPETVEATMDLE